MTIQEVVDALVAICEKSPTLWLARLRCWWFYTGLSLEWSATAWEVDYIVRTHIWPDVEEKRLGAH